jgi:hypothetical protein
MSTEEIAKRGIPVVTAYSVGEYMCVDSYEYHVKKIMKDIGLIERRDYEIINDDLNGNIKGDKIRLTKRGCRKLITD